MLSFHRTNQYVHLKVLLGLGQLHALDKVRHFAHVLEVDTKV